jgi:hypothetical protein
MRFLSKLSRIPLLLLVCASPQLQAQQQQSPRSPWAGSTLVWSNAFSLISLDPSAELTYNPTYYMVFGLRPRWSFTDRIYLSASLDITRELTQADDTTYAREAVLGDLSLVGGMNNIWTIPLVDVQVSGDITFTFPTSKVSQARTMILGVGPRLKLSRKFPLLEGLLAGFGLRATPYFHRYTTGELESPLINNCSASEGSCAAFLNTGVRNTAFRLTGSVDASLQILEWLGVQLSLGEAIDWLYALGAAGEQVSFVPQEPQDRRYVSFFQLGVSLQPLKLLEVSLSLLTYAPQLAPDSSYYNPLFNRYSTLLLDLVFQLDQITALVGGK